MSNLLTITSDNRPDNPTNGNLFYETDTNRLLLYYDGWKAYGTTNVTQQEASDIVVALYGDQAYGNALTLAKTGDLLFHTNSTENQHAVWNDDLDVAFNYGLPPKSRAVMSYPVKVDQTNIDTETTGEPLSANVDNSQSDTTFKVYNNSNPAQTYIFVDLETGQQGYLYNNNTHDYTSDESDLQVYNTGVPVTVDVTRDEYVASGDTTDGLVVFDSDLQNDKFSFVGIHQNDSMKGVIKSSGLNKTDSTWCINLSAQTFEDTLVNATPFFYTSSLIENRGPGTKAMCMYSLRFELNPHDENLPDTRHILGYSNRRLILKKYTANGDDTDPNYGRYYLSQGSSTDYWVAPGLYNADETQAPQVLAGIWFDEGVKYNLTVLADKHTYESTGPSGQTRVRIYRDGVKIHEHLSAEGTAHGLSYLRDLGQILNASTITSAEPLNAKIASYWVFEHDTLVLTEADIQAMHTYNLDHDAIRQNKAIDDMYLTVDKTGFTTKHILSLDYMKYFRNDMFSRLTADHPDLLDNTFYLYQGNYDADTGTRDGNDDAEYELYPDLFELF